MNVEKGQSYLLSDGGHAVCYEVGTWSFEVIYNKDGTLDPVSDGGVAYVREGAMAWNSWLEFVETSLPRVIDIEEKNSENS